MNQAREGLAVAASPAPELGAADFPSLLRRCLEGGGLSADEAFSAVVAIIEGRLSPAQAAGLLVAMAARGETVAEVVGAARAMRQLARRVDHGLPLVLDVVGTGGDGAGTLNLSTAAALVAAGAGVPVAKHGNRGASSPCGSADVLEALGVPLDLEPEDASALLRARGIAFLFAPVYHPAMRQVGPIRSQLGVRTLFNLLGPLANPAGAQRLLVGVYASSRLGLMAEALQELGVQAAAVVHSASGLDEVAGEGPTHVLQFDRSGQRAWTLDPEDFGIRVSLDSLRGGAPRDNARILLAVLEGAGAPAADAVLLNAALALVVAGRAEDLPEGLELARHSLAGGGAREALEALRCPAAASTAVAAGA